MKPYIFSLHHALVLQENWTKLLLWTWMVLWTVPKLFFGLPHPNLSYLDILWQPGVNFINVLLAAFTHVDPKSVKGYQWLDWIFMLSGSGHAKAAC